MATTRRTASQPQQAPPYASPAVAGAGVVVGAGLLWYGYPGMVLTWLMVTVAAWVATPAVFTGKKDASGYPTPAHPGEKAAMQRYRFWADLKWGLLFPVAAFSPGWPVYAAWAYGVVGAVAVWCLPHPWLLTRHLDAAATLILVTQVAAARRKTVAAGDTSPGVRFDVLPRVRQAGRDTLVPGAAAVVLGAAVTAYLAGGWLPDPPEPFGGYLWWVLGAVTGAGAGAAKWWVDASLSGWREVVEARLEWEPRWQMLKHDPAPHLMKREHVGAAVVDTFAAPGSMGAMAYWPLGLKIAPTMGAGQKIAVLSVPNTDSQDQPVPGSRHPLNFQVVAWPADATPDLTSTDTDQEVAALFLQCAVVWAVDALGYARPILDQAQPLAAAPAAAEGDDEDEEPPLPAAPAGPGTQAWATTWLLPDGPPFVSLRTALLGDIAAQMGCEVLVDHRAETMYVGALTSGTTNFDPQFGVDSEALRLMGVEDTWNDRWAEVMKQGVNPPTIQHPTYKEDTLSNGVAVHRQAFVTRRGVDPQEFFGLEAKIAATLDGAPYVAVCGWASRGRVGERHPQAFTVYWAHQPVPANPDTLAPPQQPSEAPQWVLSGRVNEAFKAARLAKPEVYDVTCLTTPRSRGHIWQMKLRLYGGVTLADVRAASQRIRQHLGSEWLRVKAAKDGCVLYAGASPARAQLARPQYEHDLAALDWEQAFLDAKVSGVGGLTPTLTKVDRLPNNQQVQVLDFTLPSGLAFVDVKAKAKALETSSKNAFVDVRRAPSGRADAFRLLASEVNPMPERAPFDFEAAETGSHKIPFATNLFGEPTTYDNSLDAHLLVSGVSGGGKSVALQNFIYGALVRNWDLYVVDPSKGAVDFNFAEPYARAIGRTVWEAKGIIAAIYDEVLRRKAINSAHNCGNYRDLPEEVRYNHVLIVLDEFTSMMMPEPVPKAMDDSVETLQAIESVKANNAARAYIGTYVGKIVREARSTGFTMLLATQALKADTLAKIPGANDLKDNMSRMIVGRASFGQLAAALKMPTEAPEQPDVLPPGRGMYEGNGRAAETIQCWFEPSQQVFASHLADRLTPLPPDQKVDLSGFVEPDLEIDGARIDDGAIILPPTAPSPQASSAPDEVVELGEIELSLDDLELGLDDLDDTDDEAQPSTGDAPQPAATEPPVFDWDSAERDAQTAEPDAEEDPDWPAEVAEDTDAPVDGVVVEESVVWDDIDPSPWEPAASAYGWTEIDAVLAFLADFPDVRSVTWTDPRLADEDEMGVAFVEIVSDLLAERDVALDSPALDSPAPAVPSVPQEAVVEPAPAVSPASAPDDDEFALPRVAAHLVPTDNEFA